MLHDVTTKNLACLKKKVALHNRLKHRSSFKHGETKERLVLVLLGGLMSTVCQQYSYLYGVSLRDNNKRVQKDKYWRMIVEALQQPGEVLALG